MQCKWIKVEGQTTKYFRCSLKNKVIDECKCRNCPMFIKDKKVDDSEIVKRFSEILGGNYGR